MIIILPQLKLCGNFSFGSCKWEMGKTVRLNKGPWEFIQGGGAFKRGNRVKGLNVVNDSSNSD